MRQSLLPELSLTQSVRLRECLRMRMIQATRFLTIVVVCAATLVAGEYDIVIRGGRIADGTGAPWYVADVGIRAGRIVEIGRVSVERDPVSSGPGLPDETAGKDSPAAIRVIDATGLVVAPGFIDMMGQSASPMLQDPSSAMNLLTQGITTINAGEGSSAAPLNDEEGSRVGWTTMAEYFALLDMHGLPVNVVQSVGHTQVRKIVLGDAERRPDAEELARMQQLVREGMEAGAIGVSTALIYPPAVFAETEEIAALAKIAGEYGGRYYTHMRNEGDQLLEAIEEALEIGRTAGTPVHIFHLKTAGRQNWGKMPLAIARIKAARAIGEQVTADIYPYINNGLGIAAFIHPRHFSEGYERLRQRLGNQELRDEIRKEMETTGGWENWYRHVGMDWNKVVVGQASDPKYSGSGGQTVAEIAKAAGEDPWDTFFSLVGTGAFALPQSMTDANKILAMQQEFVSFCTDVGPAGADRYASHPRAFGAFPRLFSRYVRDLGAISMERAISQASAAAANNVMAFDRGRIAEGLAADVIVFDYLAFSDKATFSKPDAVSEGMKHVIVNGQLVLDDGVLTGKRPGRVLRGPGFRADRTAPFQSAGKTDPQMKPFDEMMHQFLEKHAVPGAALAVTDHGRLVLARGYGFADIAAQTRVQPDSLFRIASLSKPITAVAILQLVEKGRLKLDDKVFDVLQYNAEIAEAGEMFDQRLRQITIEQLLQHRAGWDRDASFDPMFQSVRFAKKMNVAPPAGTQDIIRAMFVQPLDFDPGLRYAYSNFGYCLLGRVIEQVTGMGYEDYVRAHVLAPLGITGMRCGSTRLSQRADSEVRYYSPGLSHSVFEEDLGKEIASPYGAWNLEAMDSHGGWIASAIDLARFASAFDNPENCPILNAASIEKMFGRPPGLAGFDKDQKPLDVWYSLGWQNRLQSDGTVNHWHTGSLPGTATIMIRRHDGRNFIALLNSRVSPSADHLGREIDMSLHQAAAKVAEWPTADLFSLSP